MTSNPSAHAKPCEIKLLASDGAYGDYFGRSVAISGTTAIVGAHRDDDNGDYSGSAYLFDTTTGQQLFKLLPSDGAWGDNFGNSVAISDTTAIVGAFWGDVNRIASGSAYLFDTTTGQQLFKLLPDDGAYGDNFGNSVAISGTTAIVGALGDDDNGSASGSAYLFDTTTGQQLFKLLPSDGAAEDHFGRSIAISGTTAIVGAYYDDQYGNASGSAYLFDATTGQQLFKLLPSDGAAEDRFGRSVAISGTTAIVGAYGNDSASGSAYLFDTTTGQQLFRLLPSDGTADDRFGISVAISGTTAIVGAHYDDDHGSASGSAYLFDTVTGLQLFKLLPRDGGWFDYFGISVAISGDTAIVGADGDDNNGSQSGSAYLFDLDCSNYCLDLVVDNLIAGQQATFTITNGSPRAKAATVYGTKPGQESFNEYAGYCATFGIKGISQDKVIGGLNRTFDANGEITFRRSIPGNLSGRRLFFQSAQKGTCPDECMSNVVEMVVG